MKNFFESLLARLVRSEEGATAVEYGIMVAAIAAVIVAVVFALGSATNEAFQNTCDTINAEATNVSCS